MSVNNSLNLLNADQDNIAGQLDLNSLGLESVIGLNAAFPKMQEKSSVTELHEAVAGTKSGAVLYIMDDDGAFSHSTNKFYLQGVQFSNREKAQVTETFEGASLSFFGEAVKTYQFTGLALDHGADGIIGGQSGAAGFHLSALLKMYNEHMRASKLVANKQLAILRVLNHTIMGYPINFNAGYDANRDKVGTFSMTWVIVKHSLTLPGVVNNTQLDQLARNIQSSPEAAAAIANIEAILTSINALVMNKNYTQLGTDQGNMFFEGVKGIESKLDANGGIESLQAAFINQAAGNTESLKTQLLNFLADSSGMISPTIATYFGGTADNINTLFAECSTAWSNLWDDATKSLLPAQWEIIKGTLRRAVVLRETLIINKTRLGG